MTISQTMKQHINEDCGASYMNISIFNVSVVAVNGNIIGVGASYCETYDATTFDARARVFKSCKGCVLTCFGAA